MADLAETRLTADDIRRLAADLESDRVERKASLETPKTRARMREAVCAFANDMPGHGKPGYVLVGIEDDGSWSGYEITDAVLRNMADVRDSGHLLPLPEIEVYKVEVEPGITIAVLEVKPHTQPPVRYEGRTWIRVGPRRALATLEDEHVLAERRHRQPRAWDEWLCNGAQLADLRVDHIRNDYVPRRIAREVLDTLEHAARSDIDLLDTLRLWYRGVRKDGPTHGAMLLFAHRPRHFYSGLWLQFVRFDGDDRTARVIDDQEYDGDVFAQLRALEKIEPHIRTVRRADGTEGPDYPAEAIREAVINAVMHQDFTSPSPTQFYWYSDRIEVVNSGGLHSSVDPVIFSRQGPPPGFRGRRTGYRNEAVSEAMKAYGYVHKFGTGVPRIRRTMLANGNPYPQYEWDHKNFGVRLYAARVPRWETDEGEIEWLLDKEGNEPIRPVLERLERKGDEREKQGEARGLQQGRRESLYAILHARGLVISDALRARIDACEDSERLAAWIQCAATARSADDLLTCQGGQG